ncbi:Crp/Fnr family transcriptional regulator [Chitinophaga sp. Hz27]|uniref:Crp/Fnr family transcriptional regulator n=1 Tax=Chitinophaga sp. Hz27 TaxID=3347169 RepID=UPI0035D6187F
MEQYLQAFNILNEEEIAAVLKAGNNRAIKKDDYFIRSGQTCKAVAFINKGIFRSFYINEKGEEITSCFMFAGSFVTAYASFLTQCPTAENIQAITPVEMIVIPHDFILEQEKRSINWLRFLKLLAEQEYLRMEQRVLGLLKESAEKRYRDLLAKNPAYIQFISLQHLASYLGITQRHLSRIRKAVTN